MCLYLNFINAFGNVSIFPIWWKEFIALILEIWKQLESSICCCYFIKMLQNHFCKKLGFSNLSLGP